MQRRILSYSRLNRENLWIVRHTRTLPSARGASALGQLQDQDPRSTTTIIIVTRRHNTQHRAGARHSSGNLSRNLTSHSLRSLVSSSAGLGSRLCQWAAANDRPFRTRCRNRHALQRQPRTTGTAALTRNRLLQAQARHSVFEK